MAFKRVKLNHISRKALEIGHTYGYSIFYKESTDIYKSLIEAGSCFTKETQKKIDTLSINDLYVLSNDHHLYEKDTQEYLSKIVDDETISLSLKLEILYDIAKDTVAELFKTEISLAKINRTGELVDDTIKLLLSDKSAAKVMLSITTYDYYTYTHCINVSIYALGFGAYLNLSEDQLTVLGRASILHDLGKKNVPSKIVNKDGKLTAQEYEVMKNHPRYAVEILQEIGEKNSFLLELIEQHHEKINGSGYPKGLKGNEIHKLSQIISITDIFDALTTKRSYKNALRSYDALLIMKNTMQKELNNSLLEKFIHFMSDKMEKTKVNQ